jgi:ribosome-associated protein
VTDQPVAPVSFDIVWEWLSKRGEPLPELRHIAEAALERNARDPLVLDLRGISDVTDFFLIATGDSDTHTRAISENIVDRAREAGYRPVGVEGLTQGHWVLMDFVGLIVHVFLGPVRDFYRLESLWGDAPGLEFE